jgi:tetratricopeptide (TPR) repeat protein
MAKVANRRAGLTFFVPAIYARIMGCFLTANYFRYTAWAIALACLPSSFCGALRLQGQTDTPQTATVQGVIRDVSGKPVPGATVRLEAKGAPVVTVNTDHDGGYRLSSMGLGEYVLRAEKPGYANASAGPLALTRNQSKIVDLTLESANASERQKSADAGPAFFDEPHFTVAGVTDTTNLGGHGSDTIVRNREELTKATISTSDPPSVDSSPGSANAMIEKQLRQALELRPKDFDANFHLGKLLVDTGKAGEGLAFLERASRLKPDDYENGYELALARADTGDYEQARTNIFAVLNSSDKFGQKKAAPHYLLAEICEKLNHPLEAVQEYQRAAELNPSEAYLFGWGAELLLHHAAEPAVEVFAKGNQLFPRSARILEGLGASWYALGSYEKAGQRLCEASDLNPEDSKPYLLMGRLQAVESEPSSAIAERLERFVRLEPENALANYYYAISFWKGRKSSEDAESVAQVKSLLEKAIRLDPTLGLAYLQLGILFSEQKDFLNAAVAYQNAIRVTPDMEEAHYRLAQNYRQAGETSKAQTELHLYEQISKTKAAEIESQRHETQQFVYELRDPAIHGKPQ